MVLTEHEIARIGAAESQVMDLANRIDRMSETRVAVHVQMSRLKEYNRQPHHLKIASHAWEPLIQGGGCVLHRLSNEDIVFIGPSERFADLDAALQKVRKLFAADPLLVRDDPIASEFANWYDLRKNYSDFRALAERLQTAANQRRDVEQKKLQEARQSGTLATAKEPIDPQRLASLVQAIRTMDLSPLLLHQPVCAVTSADTPPQAVFNEYFIAIGELAAKLLPGVDFASDKWLFQYLTEYLDKRMLAVLPDSPEMKDPNRAISINVNVKTLLSDEFLDFDSKFRTITKKPIVLEVQPHDVFSDMHAYAFARDFCKERGYKICLDGLNHLTFTLLNRSVLKVDLLKIVWTPDLEDEAQGERRTQFEDAVKRAGASRIIMCRCDNTDAIDFGKKLGVGLFQGRFLDKRISENARSRAGGGGKRSYRQEHSQFAADRKAMEEKARQQNADS